MGKVTKFRSKVVEKEAIQWNGKNTKEVADFLGDALGPIERRMDYKLKIKTLEGTMDASPYDWIVKGLRGEFYPCKPDIFENTYEAVE